MFLQVDKFKRNKKTVGEMKRRQKETVAVEQDEKWKEKCRGLSS